MKTCILFGAGADALYSTGSGKDFAVNVIGIGTEKIDEAIKKYYETIEDDHWFPPYNNKKLSKKSILIASLRKKDVSNGKECANVKEYEKELKERADEIEQNQKAVNELLEDYTSYMGVLDEKFHSIIVPKVFGPVKFWMVVACYWRAYLYLTKQILKERDYDWLICHPLTAYREMVKADWSDEKYQNTYYTALKAYKEETEDDVCVITTNYTPICETVSGISNIAYVHGSFKWFEKPKTLEIVNVDTIGDDSKTRDFFPFIFLQSGVKPIICSQQIDEWNKAISYLKESDRLIIVGYRADYDDNHIGSIIREYLMNGKEVYYFSFDNSVKEADLCDRLRLTFITKNLIYIPVNKENSVDKFVEILKHK